MRALDCVLVPRDELILLLGAATAMVSQFAKCDCMTPSLVELDRARATLERALLSTVPGEGRN